MVLGGVQLRVWGKVTYKFGDSERLILIAYVLFKGKGRLLAILWALVRSLRGGGVRFLRVQRSTHD